MAGLGELVTPEHLYWSPGDIRAWLNQINEQIRSMGNDIAANHRRIQAASDGPRFISDFRAMRDRWLRFNREDTFAWFGAAGQSTVVGQAQEYVNAYNMLERRYRSLTGSGPTVYAELSESERPSVVRSVNYALMGWAVIGIVGIAGVGYLLSNYAKIKTLSKLTFNSRRRRSARRRR